MVASDHIQWHRMLSPTAGTIPTKAILMKFVRAVLVVVDSCRSQGLQSGLGVNFLVWPGEFQENCRRISQQISMANFVRELFGLVSPGFEAPSKIHALNSHPKSSEFLSKCPKWFHADFLLLGETRRS